MPCSHRRLQSTRNACWPGHKQALGKDGRRGRGLSLESLGNRQSGCATVCPPVPSPALLSPAIILVGPSPDFRMTLPTPPSYPHPPAPCQGQRPSNTLICLRDFSRIPGQFAQNASWPNHIQSDFSSWDLGLPSAQASLGTQTVSSFCNALLQGKPRAFGSLAHSPHPTHI